MHYEAYYLHYVTKEEKYDLEEQIISDLYNYRDPDTGGRIVGIALRNKDAQVLGLDGPDTGDIIFTINEGYNRLHGDWLSTCEGAPVYQFLEKDRGE